MAGRQNLVKETYEPLSGFYGDAAKRDVFYPGTYLPLRLESMSLIGLSDGISDRRIIDATLLIVAPRCRRVSPISESIL